MSTAADRAANSAALTLCLLEDRRAASVALAACAEALAALLERRLPHFAALPVEEHLLQDRMALVSVQAAWEAVEMLRAAVANVVADEPDGELSERSIRTLWRLADEVTSSRVRNRLIGAAMALDAWAFDGELLEAVRAEEGGATVAE